MTTLTEKRRWVVSPMTGAGRRIFKNFAAWIVALGLGAAAGSIYAAPNIVTNGGFETGDFSGWTQIGNSAFDLVQCLGGSFASEGGCAAFFGPLGSDGGIAQILNTLPGRFYDISFAFEPDGGAPSDFSTTFGGVSLISLINPAAGGFQTRNFSVLATTASTLLAFNFRDDPGFLVLDSVRVSIPEPATVALLGIGLAGLWAGRRRNTQ